LKPSGDLKSAEIIKELNCVCGCKMELQPCTCDEQTITQRLVDKYGEGILIKIISSTKGG
jgi:hypothetical protein